MKHTILTAEQVAAILSRLREPVGTLVLLGAFTGLRISELLALQWGDIDSTSCELRVSRAVVYGRVGRCKTKASQRPVPLDKALIDSLDAWRAVTAYNGAEHWVFASTRLGGHKPLTPRMLLSKHVQPAAEAAGIQGRVGFHTFRRTTATLLIANGESVKIVQELLGHANAKLTLDLYAQATTTGKREAQSRVVAMMLPKSSTSEFATAG